MINNKAYTFYVVVNGQIESGWEDKEDAKDQLGELPPGQRGKVVAKSALKGHSLNPDNDGDWMKNGRKSEKCNKRESVEDVLNHALRI